MDYQVIINLLAKILIVAALGYILRRTGVISAEMQNGFSALLLYGALPFSIIASANNEVTAETTHNLLIMVAYSAVFFAVFFTAAMLISRRLPLSDKLRRLFVTCTCVGNIAFLGMPIVLDILGSEGLLYVVSFNLINQMFVFTVAMHTISGTGKLNLRAMLHQPVTFALVIMLVVYFSPFRFPVAVQETLTSVGNMSMPLALLLLGCSLAAVSWRDMFRGVLPFAIAAIKLVIMPLIVLAAVKALALPYTLSMACVIIAGLPSGTMNSIFAEQFDCEPEFAARTVMLSMLLMSVTVPALVLLSNAVLA